MKIFTETKTCNFPAVIALFGLRFTLAQLAMEARSTGNKSCVKKEKHEHFHRKKDFTAIIALFGQRFHLHSLPSKRDLLERNVEKKKEIMKIFTEKKTCDFPAVIAFIFDYVLR